MESEYTWAPPQYDISKAPSLKTVVQPSRSEDFSENFARVAKWSPDGSTILTQCEDRTFQLSNALDSISSQASPNKIFSQPSPILDFIWYPTASPLNPASFCFIASVRECPVKLLDAADGRLRASYRIVDHRERQIAPHSMAFNMSAERLYCGFEDAVEVFDVSRPGEGTRLPTTPSKKSKDGLKGIISALAFVPSQGSDIYAAGSLSPTSSNIAMFSETQGAEPVMPHIMYAAYRRHGPIYSWDIRTNVDVPLNVFKPNTDSERTNQKLRFDVDIGGSWLASGGPDGKISMFGLNEPDVLVEPSEDYDTEEMSPALEFDAHTDAIGSVAFNPIYPMLLSVSGSRHFQSDEGSDSSGSDDDDKGQDSLLPPRVVHLRKPRPVTLDTSIKTWSFNKQNEEQPKPQDHIN
ncbi:hypothetical protein DXG01_014104 [Tephrocybe rancida]|nr:hypothetical protein DXG01_014104 [Tephrocybe rancida]